MDQKSINSVNIQLIINYTWLIAGVLMISGISLYLVELILYPELLIGDITSLLTCLALLIILISILTIICYQNRNIVIINGTMINLDK